MDGSNKQECYITVGEKGLPGTNTQAYWAHSYVMQSCEHASSWVRYA